MDVQRGMLVAGPQGRIGVVTDVVYEANGTTASIMVQRDDGQTMLIHPGSYEVDNGVVRVATMSTADQNTTATSGTTGYETRRIESDVATQAPTTAQASTVREVQPGEPVVVPVIEEQVQVGTRVVERGGIRVHKRIEEHEETVEQPTFREEVSVERVPIGRTIETAPEVREEGDTLIIPVVEEMLVVEKRLVLKEEIRVRKQRIDETEQARVVVRAEKVEIEQLPTANRDRVVGDEPVA